MSRVDQGKAAGRFGTLALMALLMLSGPPAGATAQLESQLAALRAELPGNLEGPELERVEGLVSRAEQDLSTAVDLRTEAAGLREAAEAVGSRLAALEASRSRDVREELRQWQRLLPEAEAVSSAEMRLESGRSELEAARRTLSTINAELGGLLGRPQSLVDELSAARQERDERRSGSEATDAAAAAGLQARTRQLATQAAAERAEATVELLEVRQQTLPARQRLLEAQRRAQEREINLAQQRLEVLQSRADELREAASRELRQQLLDSQQALGEDFEGLADEVSLNLELIDRLQSLERTLAATRQAAEASARDTTMTEDALRSTRARLALGDTDDALGLVLLAERRRLTDTRRLQSQLQETRRQLASAQLSVLDLNDRMIGLDDVDSAVRLSLRERSDEEEASDDALALREALEQLLEVRARLLPDLLETTQLLVTSLAERERSLQQQISVTAELEDLLDQRLLWIPSHGVADLAWLARHPAGWFDLYKPSRFPTTLRLMRASVVDNWPATLASLLLLLSIPLLRQPLSARFEKWAAQLRHVNDDRFRFTFLTLLATLLAALPLALAVFGLAWLLQQAGETGRYSDSLGRALALTTPTIYVYSLLYWLCRPGGLAVAHFRWPDTRVRALGLLRHWLLAGVVPLQFTLNLAFVRNLDPALDTAGRDVTLALCMLFGFLAWRMLGPDGVWATREEGAHHRQRRFARVALTSTLGVMALLTLAGYLLSVGLLLLNLWLTTLLVLLVGVFQALLARWLLLSERRLAMRRYLDRKASEADAEAQPEVVTETGDVIPDIEPDEVTLQSVSAQTRRLLRALVISLLALGLLWVWSDILPALGRLDEVVLWQVNALDSSGVAVMDAVTLKGLMFGLFALVLTFIAARNLPGLVEIGLLSSAAVDAPTRYAITSIFQYVIVIGGLVVGVGLLGLRWSQLQWMAAALTVGLGFGLQEIFANFVSGLILLFERPFRIGDVITIGEITGTVTKIRTRATTLRDFDNKEIVVPNKTFITDQLTNWTLSDTRTRLILSVGVAYGTPPEKVHALLRRAANEHPLVMQDPGPASWFMAFGASSLDFELRVFVASFADRLVAMNELNMRIAALFAENDIEIAFPQMDLHVRDLPPRRPRTPPGAEPEAPEPSPAR